jgi:hypothetical protein
MGFKPIAVGIVPVETSRMRSIHIKIEITYFFSSSNSYGKYGDDEIGSEAHVKKYL